MEIGLAFFSGDGDRDNALDFYVKAAVWADGHGLKAIWTPERHYHPFGGAFPDPAVASAAVAVRTRSIELRAGSVISPLHDIVEVVERWSMVDAMSGGRVSLGFASGWRVEDFALRPEAFASRRETMWRQIEVAKHLWSGGSLERRDGEGKSFTLRIYPRPARRDLPIWISTAGSAHGVQSAAAIGAGLFTHLATQSLQQLSEMIRHYRSFLPDGRRGRVAVMVHTCVAATDREARALAERPLRGYLEKWLTLSDGAPSGEGDAVRNIMLDVAVNRYLKGRSLIGSVDTCRAFLATLRGIGVDEVACLVDFGIDDEIVFESLPRIAELLPGPGEGGA